MLGFMHPSSVCLRFSTFSSFSRDIRPSYSFGKRLRQNRDIVRLLHQQDVGAFSKAHRAPHFEESNGRAGTTVVKKKAEDSKDIFIDDLSATLEAHRVTNRFRFIRKVASGPPLHKIGLYKIASGPPPLSKKGIRKQSSYPRLDPSVDHGSTLDQMQTAPADVTSTVSENKIDSQNDVAASPTIIKKQLMGIEQKKPSVFLDYEGVAKEPRKKWNLRFSEGREQSPWLPLVTTTEGDGLARYVCHVYCLPLALTD